jgi:hypothetical protein
MKPPDKRTLQLVKNVARAFEEYHGERRGNWACYCQAVNILIKAGPLADFDGVDLLKFESQRKWEASPATSSASLAWDERAPPGRRALPLGWAPPCGRDTDAL